MDVPTKINRRAAFASIAGASVATVALAVPTVTAVVGQGGDIELIAMVDEWRETRAAAAAAWDVARPLTDKAVAMFGATGQDMDANWDKFCAMHDRVGAGAAEEAADGLSDRQAELAARIRDCTPTSVAGLCAKFEVLRYWIDIEDVKPRDDQDCHEEFFNVFANDLVALRNRRAGGAA